MQPTLVSMVLAVVLLTPGAQAADSYVNSSDELVVLNTAHDRILVVPADREELYQHPELSWVAGVVEQRGGTIVQAQRVGGSFDKVDGGRVLVGVQWGAKARPFQAGVAW